MNLHQLCIPVLLGGAVLGAQAIPARPEQVPVKPLQFTVPKTAPYTAKLKNGIPVFIAPDPGGVPFIRLTLSFRGGAYLEPQGKPGFANIFDQVWRQGGTRQLPSEKLNERLSFLVTNFQASLGSTAGSLNIRLMENDLNEGLDLFMEILREPAFEQAKLDQAKQETLQFLEGLNDSAGMIGGYQLGYLINGEGHFTTQRTTAASIKSITREDLLAFHAQILHPENMAITISGKFERKAMLALLDRTLGAFKAAATARVSPPVPAPTQVRKPGIYVVDKAVSQAAVSLTGPGLRRSDPDWHAVMVMNKLLGGGFNSRLMKKIRSDEGLTYGIGTGFGDGTYWRGDWSCNFSTKNASVAYALKLALAEFENMKKLPPTEEELKNIKETILNAFPIGWSNPHSVVTHFTNEYLQGKPADWYQDYQAKVQAVTAADVVRVAQKYLDPSQLIVVIVGKAAELEQGDEKDHPGLLKDVTPLPLVHLPLRDPLTLKPLK